MLPDSRKPGHEALMGHSSGKQGLAVPVHDVTLDEGEPHLDHGDVGRESHLSNRPTRPRPHTADALDLDTRDVARGRIVHRGQPIILNKNLLKNESNCGILDTEQHIVTHWASPNRHHLVSFPSISDHNFIFDLP